MEKLVLYIKTYEPDFERVYKLIESIEHYNRDNIPLVISVNDEHFEKLPFQYHQKYKVYKDSDITTTTIKEGWRYQQIIKASFYKLKISKNYVALDSDSLFIRDFYISDFMYDDDTPYTIMHESKDLMEISEKIGLDSHEIFFQKALRDTRPFFGNHGKKWDYGPSPYSWSCKVWEHLHEVYLKKINLTFDEFFNQIDQKSHSPSECSIYGEYLLKTRLINIYPIEGYFKVYHYKKQYKKEKNELSIDQLKKIYLGIIYQSNWDKKRKHFWQIWRRK